MSLAEAQQLVPGLLGSATVECVDRAGRRLTTDQMLAVLRGHDDAPEGVHWRPRARVQKGPESEHVPQTGSATEHNAATTGQQAPEGATLDG